MKVGDTVYVEKSQYDILLRQFMHLKFKYDQLNTAWNKVKESTTRFDDMVLNDIHRFGSLQEENAYIVGSFNTLLSVKYYINELEEMHHV